MSIKPVLSFRGFFVGAVAMILLGIGVFALGERVLPAKLVELFTAEAAAKTADGEIPKDVDASEPLKPTAPARKAMGSLNDGILFGNGDLPLGFPNRIDKIYTLGPAGEPIEIAGVNDFEPSWSPDGEKIVFVSLRDGPATGSFFTRQQYREIYIMNANGTDQKRLFGAFFGGESQPAFSPEAEPDRKIIYVADYTPGGQPSGIYTMDTDGYNQARIDTDGCFDPMQRTNLAKRHFGDRTESNFFPGIYGFDTPNYSPDGTHIIFGYPGADGVDVYRIEPNGANCTKIYTGEGGSQVAATARYSRDGTRIALYHRDGNNLTHNLRIIDAVTGSVLEDQQPTNFMGYPLWVPDGSDHIAYIGGDQNPDGEIQNLEIWVVNLNSQIADPIYLQTVPEAVRGIDWGVPTTAIPALSMRINSPNPLTSGQSTTGTVFLAEPAPVGGVTVTLQALGDVGPPPAMTVPPDVFIPEGQTQADFAISSSVSTLYRSANVLATRPSPNYAYSIATVSLSPSKPDLRAVSFTAPPEVSPGAPFNLSWTVDNIGPVATGSNGGLDAVYFSLDNILDTNDDPQITTIGNSALAAGASRTRNTSVSIVGAVVPGPGQYYLIFRTNPGEVVNEDGHVANNSITVPIQINLADIVIEDINAPAVIEPGVYYNISWSIRNAGLASTGSNPFANRIYYSADNIAGNSDDLDISAFSYDYTDLAAGATVTQSQSVTIPTVPVRPSGLAFFYVKADFFNNVYEGSPSGAGETNNTTFKSIQFDYKVADLTVTSTGVPPEVETDTVFALEWTTANIGNKSANTFADNVYFSTDNQVGSDIQIGTFTLTGGLAAGASVNRIQNVTIPTSAILASGNYFVYVKTDGNSAINEGVNEDNNTRFQLVNVRRLLRPDLTVTNITAPSSVFFDQTIQVQWTVTNSGQGPTNTPQWNDTLYISTSPTSGGTQLANATSISALNAGESYIASATVKIPRGFNGGYHFIVKTDSSGAVNEESETNNLRSSAVQVNVPPLPDLIVESVQVPTATAFAGSPISIAYTIRNQGTGSAGRWFDRIYLSRDTTLNTSQAKLFFTSDGYDSNGLAANSSRMLTSQNRIPGTFNPVQYTPAYLPGNVEGLWYVFVVTDYRNDVYEFNDENNNVNYDRVQPGSPINILVTPPDLVIPNQLVAPPTVASGQSMAVSFTVKNQGAFNASLNLRHGVYLSTDQKFDAADTFLGSFIDPDFFTPGAEHPVSLNVGLPNCLGNGTYYLFAVADYDKRQYEFDPNFDAEANNASPPRPVQLATLPPDLQVTNIQIPPISTPGQSFSLAWTVTNAGTGPATQQWNDRVVLKSTDPQIPALTLGSFDHIGGLIDGANYTSTRTIGLPAYMQGEYYLSITADYNGTVPECGTSETNNTTDSTHFTVQNNLTDLVIDSVTAPSSAVIGDSFAVQWTGRNANGAMPANAESWNDTVYLSTDTTVSNDDIAIGSGLNALILAGGQNYQKQAQVRAGNVPAGTYYLVTFADSGRRIYEGPFNSAFETNNSRASAPITLTSPAVDLQVGNVSVTPPFYSGTNIGVSFTVTNGGTSPTLGTYWSDYVILSRDAVYDPTDKILGYTTRTTALGGGANYTVSAGFPVPAGLTGGYSIFVITDYGNNIVESSNTNNTSLPFAINLVLPPPADLNVTNVTPPITVNLGESVTFSWTVQNIGPNAVAGKWRDTVYLSRDQFLDSSDLLAVQYDLDSTTTPVAPNATYTKSSSLGQTPIEEGTYYVIVRTDAQNRIRESNEGNNVTSSISQTTVTIPQLQMDTPYPTTLVNGGQKFFKLSPPAFETMLMTLTTDLPNRSNELLTKFGTVASRADFDFQGSRPGESNPTNLVPETGEGNYYSLVRHERIPDSPLDPALPQNITVKAQILPFSIRGVSPEVAGNAGFATLIAEGAKFQAGAAIKLVGASGNEISPIQRKVATTKIAAIFDLRGKPTGHYNVVVTNPNNAAVTLNNGFEIVSGGGHSLRQSIVGPSAIRYTGGGRTRYTFTASNDGLNDAINVPILVALPAGMNYELDRSNYVDISAGQLPEGMTQADVPVHIDRDGVRIVFLIAPIVRSRSSVHVNLDLFIPFGGSQFKISYAVLPPLAELYGSALKDPEAQARYMRKMLAPNVSDAAACWLEYARQMFFALLGLFGPADECYAAAVNTLTFVADLSTGIALDYAVGDGKIEPLDIAGLGAGKLLSLASTILTCAGNSLPWVSYLSALLTTVQLSKQLYDCLNKTTEYLVSRPVSIDPNEKISPDGYGAEKFVGIKQPMLYRINFENVATATAPAQKIRITDVLPATLDPQTVRIKEIGFKQNVITVADNQAFYQSRITLGADLNNLKADITAGLDVVNGQVFWTLTAIDPQTGEQPTDPLLGLLPPNNANKDGEGFVTFTVEPKTSYPNRTGINNLATIIFDDNEAIVTNTTANLLDSSVPTSSVAALPPFSETPEIGLSWNSTDDADGSGFKSVEARVFEDGGGFVTSLTSSTLDGSGTFDGKWGKKYKIFSIAWDNAGNVEMPPTLPDAEITVRGGDTESDLAPRPNGNDGLLSADDTAQVRRFVAGFDTDFTYNEFQRSDMSPRDGGGNGTLSVADIMQARRFVAGLDTKADAAGPNEPSGIALRTVPGKKSVMLPREIRAKTIARFQNQVIVGVRLEAQGDETGLGFALSFDPAVLSNPVVTLGADTGGSTLTVNTAQVGAGKLGILLDRAPNAPIAAGNKLVIRVVFDIAIGAPMTTQLTFGNDPVISEVVDGLANSLTTTFSPSTISLAGPTAAGVLVSGTVFRRNGSPLRNARVTITDTSGASHSALTSSFGSFRFEDIAAGQNYTVDVRAKGYVFTPRIIAVSDDIEGLEFSPEP